MKKILLTSIILSSLPFVAIADTSVVAKMIGKAKVKTSEVTKHRKSLDCYVSGKGDDYKDYGAQIVNLDSSEKSLSGSGRISWGAGVSSPFSATVRETTLTSNVVSDASGDHVSIKLQDSFVGSLGKIHSEKCRHTDGYATVNDATIAGNVKIRYQVPANVWAVTLKRSRNEGVFKLDNTKPISNAFNSGYDIGKASELVLWVKPGQILEQEVEIAEFIGPANLGEIRLEFLPLGELMSPEKMDNFLTKIKTSGKLTTLANDKKSNFLVETMGMVRAGQDISLYTRKLSLRELKNISDEYFYLANAVFSNDVRGQTLKVASALAAFQISQAILKEMGAYCKDVDVYLPFTGETQKVLGLRAASFWLSRSMSFVRTFSYAPIETFILELKKKQDQGMSPADISNNKELKKQIQEAYLLLTKTSTFESGPFNRAYVDFNKMAKTFTKIQSLGPKQVELIEKLKAGDALEAEFVSNFESVIAQLRPTNKGKLNYEALLSQMSELKARQVDVVKLMSESVRILSIDYTEGQDQVISQVLGLLNHQVNIFKNNVGVPYFDGIREAFYNANVRDLDGVAQGCFQLDGVNL